MQSGTVGAFINQFARQVFVDSDITLSAQQLNGTIIVDNSTGPVTVTLPPAVSIRAGGYFQVFALTGNNPVTVVVQPGDVYNDGTSTPIVLTSVGQILTIFATNAPTLWGIPLTSGIGSGLEVMVGPFDFRAPAYGFDPTKVAPIAPPVESYVTERTIGLLDFSAFRITPDPGPPLPITTWSHTLPRRNSPVGTYSLTLTLEYSDDPGTSFAGALEVGLANQPEAIDVLPFAPATDVQVVAAGTAAGAALSVLEWQFDNPLGKPFVAFKMTRPIAAPGIVYLYQAVLSYRGS